MIIDDLKNHITSRVPGLKDSKRWKKANCPVCSLRGESIDKRRRFGVIFQDDKVGLHCFNCKFKARYTNGEHISKDMCWFLSAVGVDFHEIERLKFNSNHQLYKNGSVLIKRDKKNIADAWGEILLPEGANTLENLAISDCQDAKFIEVCAYVINRKLTCFDKLMWTPSSEHNLDRKLMIPCYYKDKTCGYIARSLTTTTKNIPKYFKSVPDNFVFNLDAQQGRKYCILSEGALDALVTEGISCLGNNINQDQADLINSMGVSIIVCPDREESGQGLVDIALKNDWAVSFPKWENNIKDAAEANAKYGKLYTIKSILDGAENNKLKINVLRKLEKNRWK